MIYLAWAVLYEGESDAAYYDVMIPRLMDDLVRAGTKFPTIPEAPAVRFRRASIEAVAQEACELRDAFYLAFIHSDAGGRGLQRTLGNRSCSYCEKMNELCDWPRTTCIVLAPERETETWLLADPQAILGSLGYTGTAASLSLPENVRQAERLQDPKGVLRNAVDLVRRRPSRGEAGEIYSTIAQRQDLGKLRQAASFRGFEERLSLALRELHCL
jgi:hypothetical protein